MPPSRGVAGAPCTLFARRKPMPHTNPDHADLATAAGEPDRWQRVLDALYAAGAAAGAAAADWWAQDTVGGRASGDTAATARRVLAGIDDSDPLILDAPPGCAPPTQDPEIASVAELYADAVPADAPWRRTPSPGHAAGRTPSHPPQERGQS